MAEDNYLPSLQQQRHFAPIFAVQRDFRRASHEQQDAYLPCLHKVDVFLETSGVFEELSISQNVFFF